MPTDPPSSGHGRWGRFITPADLRHDGNVFTLVGWVLASAVMFSHAFELTGHHAGADSDPSRWLLPFPVSRLAVLLFFSLSGFLVTGSLVKRGVGDFVVARSLRLVPGLWAMLAVTTVIAGLVFTAQPMAAYVANPGVHRYIAFNAILLGQAYAIADVFAANPLPFIVNGSLWTIPQEVRCYLALALIGATGLLVHRRVFTTLFVLAEIVDLLVPGDAVRFLAAPRPLALSFFLGVLFYLWRERLFLSWPLATVAVASALLMPIGDLKLAVAAVAFAYTMLVVAIVVPARLKGLSAIVPDYSYGIYIYAFPAQQAAFALGVGKTPYANMAAAYLLMLPLAALSWHFVEKPALALKARWSRPTTR